jgi:hypothetical protein
MKVRVVDGIIVEVLKPIAGFSIEQCFHKDILAQCEDAYEGANVGDKYNPPAPALPPALETPIPAAEPAPEAPVAPVETTVASA